MFKDTSKKRLEAELRISYSALEGAEGLNKVYLKELEEYERTWKSPEGQIILNDFQRALNLIVAYQGSLNTLAAPDPHVVDARLLLSKYGQKGLTSGRGVKGLEEFIQTREDKAASGKLKS